jgi:hypothetical protein
VKVIASVTQKSLVAALCECVNQEAVVNTDEHLGYKSPLKHWKEHQTVNHSRGEYQRRNPDGSRTSTILRNHSFRCSNAPSLERGIIFLGSTCPDMPTNSLSGGIHARTVMASGWKGLPDGSRANG